MRNTWMTTKDVRREIASALRMVAERWLGADRWASNDNAKTRIDLLFEIADALDPPVAEKSTMSEAETPPRMFKDGQCVKTAADGICFVKSAYASSSGGWRYLLSNGSDWSESFLTASPPPLPTLEQKALCCPGERVRVKDNLIDENGVPGERVTGTKFAGRVGRVRGSHDTCSLPVLEVQLDGDDKSYEVWLHNTGPE